VLGNRTESGAVTGHVTQSLAVDGVEFNARVNLRFAAEPLPVLSTDTNPRHALFVTAMSG
jgi:hypothetical protein